MSDSRPAPYIRDLVQLLGSQVVFEEGSGKQQRSKFVENFVKGKALIAHVFGCTVTAACLKTDISLRVS